MSQNANFIFKRLKEVLALKSDKSLCMLLNIKNNTLSSWKKRNTFDFNKIIALCHEKDLDLNFIFFGEVETPKKEPDEIEEIPQREAYNQVVKFYNFKLNTSNRNLALFHLNSIAHEHINDEVFITQKVTVKSVKPYFHYVFQTSAYYFICKVEKVLKDELVVTNHDLDRGNNTEGTQNIRIDSLNSAWELLELFPVSSLLESMKNKK